MRIAFCISPGDTVPQKEEKILAPWILAEQLIHGLVERGHEVTTFCADGSSIPGEMVTLGIQPFFAQKATWAKGRYYRHAIFQEQRLVGEAVRLALAGKFDLIHIFHGTLRVLPVLQFSPVPVICTIHDPFPGPERFMYDAYSQFNHLHLVALSQSHRREAGDLPIAEVVYNGLELEKIPFVASPKNQLLISGRIKPEKGFDTAIAAARAAGVPLVLAGENFADVPLDAQYWAEKVQPEIDGKQVQYAGIIRRKDLYKLYGVAKALLFPIQWSEPFGMVMIEAMAAGTPVIAFNRGSVPEIIKDGVTGFVIEPEEVGDLGNLGNLKIQKRGVAGLVEAIQRIGEIDRAECRRHVAENFTAERMVGGYEGVYKKVLRDLKGI